MKILAIVDKRGSAIDQLTKQVARRLDHLNMEVLPVHPKRPDRGTLDLFEKKYQEADFIFWGYWKTAEMLREKFPDCKKVPSLLVHHNPYNLKEKDWVGYDKVVVKNQFQKSILPLAEVVEHNIDTDRFPWNRNYKDHSPLRVGMVAARIEGKKGILPVAKACVANGWQLVLTGRVSDDSYFLDIRDAFGEFGHLLEFNSDVDDQTLANIYHSLDLLVVNSVDDFESGPLPILEAMSSGVPVAARSVGLVPDLPKDSYYLLDNDSDDSDKLAVNIRNILGDSEKRKKIRQAGWEVAKYRDDRYAAKRYEGLIYEILYGGPLVSVIIPTCDRPEQLEKLIQSLDKQTYPAIEIVVADDGNPEGEKVFNMVNLIKDSIKKPIKLVHVNDPGYGLAKARNMGAIAASGQYFLFLDDRHVPEENAVEKFVELYKPNSWLYGKKDGVSKEFVENFSFISRQDFFDFGMFCERIREYGGLSQETRVRARKGFNLELKEVDVHAKTQIKTKSRETKRDQIIHMKHLLWIMGK